MSRFNDLRAILGAAAQGLLLHPAEMGRYEAVPLVRCHLAPGDDPAETLRYVRLAEFELWRYMMETRHGRVVVVEEVSLWVPEDASLLTSAIGDPELCEAVVRIHFEVPGSHGVPVPVERFLLRPDLSGSAGRPARALRVRLSRRDRDRRVLRPRGGEARSGGLLGPLAVATARWRRC